MSKQKAQHYSSTANNPWACSCWILIGLACLCDQPLLAVPVLQTERGISLLHQPYGAEHLWAKCGLKACTYAVSWMWQVSQWCAKSCRQVDARDVWSCLFWGGHIHLNLWEPMAISYCENLGERRYYGEWVRHTCASIGRRSPDHLLVSSWGCISPAGVPTVADCVTLHLAMTFSVSRFGNGS